MTTFNPENKDSLTYSESLDPAMKITDQADADQYKAAYIAFIERFLKHGKGENGLTAEQIANSNLGYYAGYYHHETRVRLERLFKCQHPVFGSANNTVTPESALQKGIELANK